MGLRVALVIIGLLMAAGDALAQPQPCEAQASKTVAYASSNSRDTLMVRVAGAPCSKARVFIQVISPQGLELYAYEGEFIKHMPYLIHEPELNSLVQFFVDKVLNSAITRTTKSLPEYTGLDDYYESTNDFLMIAVEDYDQLRQQSRPILWHITSESTWVHHVYDAEAGASVQIMRGGVFY